MVKSNERVEGWEEVTLANDMGSEIVFRGSAACRAFLLR